MNNSLKELANKAKKRTISELFYLPSNENRAKIFSLAAAGLYLDYAKQNVTADELAALIDWAENQQLSEKIKQVFNGELVNNTEHRAVLHSLLRATNENKQAVLKVQAQEVINTEERMANIVSDITSGKLCGITGKRFTDVLAIGIGGSFYGVKVGLSALEAYCSTGLKVHVLANIDGDAVAEKLQQLNAETTLVIVISKTFTTQETLLNANSVKKWLLSSLSAVNHNVDVSIDENEIIKKHCLAVSSNVKKANEFGIVSEHIFPMWDWVGGRFSVWSAVGLPLALAIGIDNFNAFKAGAKMMDDHFLNAPFSQNMPVLLALLGIWNRNFLHYPALAILPYSHALRALPGYLQQTDMESNGKSVSHAGKKLTWQSAPIVFGQEGTNSQHAFMQLMHQSDDIIPTDFIAIMKGHNKVYQHHQKILVANCFAQSEALMQGKSLKQVTDELQQQGLTKAQVEELAPHKTMKGNTPSNTLVMEALTPSTFGALLALYEHKILVQGLLWQVNSFDQWGVELGKQLGQNILAAMAGENNENLSSSSAELIHYFQQNG